MQLMTDVYSEGTQSSTSSVDDDGAVALDRVPGQLTLVDSHEESWDTLCRLSVSSSDSTNCDPLTQCITPKDTINFLQEEVMMDHI